MFSISKLLIIIKEFKDIGYVKIHPCISLHMKNHMPIGSKLHPTSSLFQTKDLALLGNKFVAKVCSPYDHIRLKSPLMQ